MRRIPPYQTFKFKITALLVLMVMLASVLVGGASLVVAEREMRAVIGNQEMATLAGAAAYLDRDISSKQQVLRVLAEGLQATPVPHGQVQAQLEQRSGLRDEFANVAALDRHGQLIANLQDRRMVGKLNSHGRQFFRDTLAVRDSVVSAPFRSVLTGRPVVAVTQPVLGAAGAIDYVLVGTIDLQRPAFAGQLQALRGHASGKLFIVAADGTTVYHPDPTRLLAREAPGSLAHAALSGPDGWRVDLQDQGRATMLAHTRLKRVDWTIALAMPLQDVFAGMDGVRLRALGTAALAALLAGLLGWWLMRAMLAPLYQLYGRVLALGRAEGDVEQFNSARRDEFGQLSRAFYQVSRQHQTAERNLQRLATTDPLTGAHNRRMFDEFFPQALKRAIRAGQQIGLAVLDIDHFKDINDNHGHQAGDAVLVQFADRLRQAVRSTDTVARIAGDEFVIVFEHLDAAHDVNLLGEKVVAAMKAPFNVNGKALEVTASIGIALTTELPADVEKVMLAADQALYCVKAAGRNGFAVNCVGAERMLSVRDFGAPAKADKKPTWPSSRL
ncbi:diguanylate cyclase [Pseudoduganella sp. DS3]|uniref:Diguanylate cyclase n=1 Tax=Pseudoduganella guangdongensis TaxID=2692179 RepID=A0A6N9HME9_9BURK|nr:sensor domain-containing diguanylate cyclase [Pseudoduganella guangdongensis]MYN04457.1 diguanylate cyclase [Pseudoduganella guangdongensis]